MKFIKLTNFNSKQNFLVNLDLIDVIQWETDGKEPYTLLYRAGVKSSWYTAKESPEEIFHLMNSRQYEPSLSGCMYKINRDGAQ